MDVDKATEQLLDACLQMFRNTIPDGDYELVDKEYLRRTKSACEILQNAIFLQKKKMKGTR